MVTERSIQTRLRIYDLLKEGDAHATYSAEEVRELLGSPWVPVRSVGRLLSDLGFDQPEPQRVSREKHHFCYRYRGVNNGSTKSKRFVRGRKSFRAFSYKSCGKSGCGSIQIKTPARWRRPVTWPPILELQKEMRTLGASWYAVRRATEHAAEIDALITSAIEEISADGGRITDRGKLMMVLRRIVRALYYDSVPRADLARVLGESYDAPRAALLARVGGLIRYATRKEIDCSRPCCAGTVAVP